MLEARSSEVAAISEIRFLTSNLAGISARFVSQRCFAYRFVFDSRNL